MQPTRQLNSEIIIASYRRNTHKHLFIQFYYIADKDISLGYYLIAVEITDVVTCHGVNVALLDKWAFSVEFQYFSGSGSCL